MNKIATRYITSVAIGMAVLCAVTVRAQDTADGAESSAAPPASSDQPIRETSDSSQGEPENPIEKRAKVGLVIGPKLGASFGQVFSDLDTSFIGELEIGYLLPLPQPVGRSVELFVSLQYTQPGLDGKTSLKDPRLPDAGTMSYNITQQQLLLTPGILYRLPLGGEVGALLRPYTALGARVYMLRTKVKGSAGGEAFGQNEETDTEVGFYFSIGGDLFLGPGSLFLEAQISYASLDGYIMRNTSAGSLNLAVGYRLFL